MQDLRQDYGGDGGGGWRGGRGGRGPPMGSRGRGDGGDFRGRGSSYDLYPRDEGKYEQRRQVNHKTLIRKRTIQSLDISPTMTAPNVLAARDEALTASHPAQGVLNPSFEHQPYEPQTLMHGAFHSRQLPLPSIINTNSTTTTHQQLDAGDLSVALEASINKFRDREGKESLIKSKIGGYFVARRDQEEIVRKSTTSR